MRRSNSVASLESRSGSCCRSRSVALSEGTSTRRSRVPCLLRELSLKELAEIEAGLSQDLSAQSPLSAQLFAPLLRVPTPAQVREMSAYRAILLMMVLDLCRPFHVARLRVRVLGWSRVLRHFGGLMRTSNEDLERAIRIARTKAALSKRIAFLSRSQQVFHLWHVIHRPFSYSFAVLALIHIVVVMALGFV